MPKTNKASAPRWLCECTSQATARIAIQVLPTSVLGIPSAPFFSSNFLSRIILLIRSSRFMTLRFPVNLAETFKLLFRLIENSLSDRFPGVCSGLIFHPVRPGEIGSPFVFALPDRSKPHHFGLKPGASFVFLAILLPGDSPKGDH